MAGVKGRSGGARPGSGRPRINPRPSEVWALLKDVQARLVRLEREERGVLLLRRLTAIEQLLRPAPVVPRHTRRRPLGAG